jgi:hypothetical protein
MRGFHSVTLASDQNRHARQPKGPLTVRHILLLGSLSTGEFMKRQWRVLREVMERPDARQRWDRAYQSILRWGLETDQHSDPSANGKEEYHASSGIRPGLDLQAGQTRDYPEQQLEMVQKHAQEQGWELLEENIFRDDGYSGTTLKRPALDALRDKARVRELEVVVVLSPDRLARNGKSTRWS